MSEQNLPTAPSGNTRVLLRQLGLQPSKGLGQNFLVDPSVPEKILAAAQLTPDEAVVEVGPGVGVLTLRLAPLVRRLTAVELDRRLYPYLREALAVFPGARLVEGDVLNFAPRQLEPEPYKLIANIPYYITSAILRHFLESDHRPERIVLMVQKEVAQRIVAQPPDMSLLAVSVQFYGRPKLWATVPAGAFWPPPKVNSAILVIETSPALPDVDEKRFFALVRAGFSQKRKQLRNTLASGLKLDKATVIAALESAGIAPERRAESLGLAEWEKVYKILD